MKKAIYKIENMINHKIYIGQSMYPERRFEQHIKGQSGAEISLIHRAILKYGVENFTFEILGWFENYNEKEKYYIKLYDCLKPQGYNIQAGGEEPPILAGEKNPHSTITQEIADGIINQLLDYAIPRKTICANYNVSKDLVRHINEGNSWRKKELTYPLRPPEKELDKARVLYIQKLCCDKSIPLNTIGEKVGWKRSSAKMINSGSNHYNSKLKYPIRDNAEYNKQILNQETCIDYLHFGE